MKDDRAWMVYVGRAAYRVAAPSYWAARWAGCKRHVKVNPRTTKSVAEWCRSPRVRVRVVDDRRYK